MSNTSFLQTTSPQPGALVSVESSRAIQEVQAALIIAKKFPRDEKAAIDRIINACTRPTLANSALYQYSRGGTDITGPSIRLAETLAQNWGNLQFGIRELEQADGESTVEAFAWDVETNTRQTKVFQVRHERHTRSGVKDLTDPRDIYELIANQGARRLRSCILGIIPGDIVELAVDQCETTLNTNADTSPAAQAKIVETFSAYGVTKGQIEAFIQRRIDAITAGQVVRLRKIVQSLKDGISSPSDWFKDEVKGATVPGAGDKAQGGEQPKDPAAPAATAQKARQTPRKAQAEEKPAEALQKPSEAPREEPDTSVTPQEPTKPVERPTVIERARAATAAAAAKPAPQDDEIPGLSVARKPADELKALLQESKLTWKAIAETADAGGIFVDTSAGIADQHEEVIQDILNSWGAIVGAIKQGGAQ